MLAAVILSGGSSSRMGSPKALLPYQGRPFLDHVLEITRHPEIGVRRIVLGAHAEPIGKLVDLAEDEIVINENWKEGQLSSLHAALRSLPAKTDGLILFLIDHPLISADLVSRLISHFYSSHALIALPVFRGQRGHPVVFSSTLYPELLAAPMDKGARAVVWANKNDVHEYVTTEEGCVLNLNDPATFTRFANPSK